MDYQDRELNQFERDLLTALRAYGHIRHITALVNKLKTKQFGDAQDQFKVVVNQNGKRWSISVTKEDFIEV